MAGMTAFVRGTLATKESVWAHDVVWIVFMMTENAGHETLTLTKD
jgi:hypothetical protein